jgi:hypothetical protein
MLPVKPADHVPAHFAICIFLVVVLRIFDGLNTWAIFGFALPEIFPVLLIGAPMSAISVLTLVYLAHGCRYGLF